MDKKDCWTCAYKGEIPGDAHICCRYKEWTLLTVPRGKDTGIEGGWWHFPFNFDPIWMLKPCPQWTEGANEEDMAEENPLFAILSLLR